MCFDKQFVESDGCSSRLALATLEFNRKRKSRANDKLAIEFESSTRTRKRQRSRQTLAFASAKVARERLRRSEAHLELHGRSSRARARHELASKRRAHRDLPPNASRDRNSKQGGGAKLHSRTDARARLFVVFVFLNRSPSKAAANNETQVRAKRFAVQLTRLSCLRANVARFAAFGWRLLRACACT